jgi:hypothetical protein
MLAVPGFLTQRLAPPPSGWAQKHPLPHVASSVPTVHVWHVPPLQKALAQSFGDVQPWPVVQRGQEPPQSTPVSLPFLTPSVQVAQRPPSHVPPGHGVPSDFFLHLPCLRFLQGGHLFFASAS